MLASRPSLPFFLSRKRPTRCRSRSILFSFRNSERQRAGASAQNEWQRGTEANMRKKPKTGEGRGNKRRQSQPGRDVGGAKHETGRNGQNDKRHGRERTEAGAAKEGNKESEQNKISMVHSS
ncbi:hypothetical protein TNCV_4869891 [Trichonephila clavipes]|nr:hypothetical protein TNCV_4869891 [Trichonephila clavipes]